MFGVLPPPQTDVGALCICVAGNFGVALTWGGLLGGSRGHAAALFLGGGGLWACPRLRRGKAKAAGERVAASAWQGLVLGCSLGGPHPRPLHLPPPPPLVVLGPRVPSIPTYSWVSQSCLSFPTCRMGLVILNHP